MSKIEKTCENCGSFLLLFPSRIKKAKIFFCNKSCHRTYKNNINNPSWFRDLSGENNPMYGKTHIGCFKGIKGEKHFNWQGGLHRRKDGYFRINVDGKRYLYHRWLLKEKLKGKEIVHHKDINPSNNDLSNLEILLNQSNHASLHAKLRNI